MHKPFSRTGDGQKKLYADKHRYEHWLVDNQVYFITARCRDRLPAFAFEEAKAVFWRQFTKYTAKYNFTPWVTSLLNNHYHTLGYLRFGKDLPLLIQCLHGSTAKLVNDLLPERFPSFWRGQKGKEYFDGCIRDEKQGRLAFRYTLLQSERHGVCHDWREYEHTRVNVELERAIRRSHELHAFLGGVPYKRYLKRGGRGA